MKPFLLLSLVCLVVICSSTSLRAQTTARISDIGSAGDTNTSVQFDDDVPPASAADPKPDARKFQFPKLPAFPKPKLPQMPKLSLPKFKMPAKKPASNTDPKEPSAWAKFNQNSKKFFSKAKTTLMPWTENKPASTPQRSERVASRPNSSRPSFPFFGSKTEAKPKEDVRTVNDFLALPRIGNE